MRFKVMPFGMVNSGSTYNRMVRKLLEGAQDLECYVDDVLGHTKDWNRHIQMLRDFFESVRRANLCLRPSKCKIGFDTVDFLGHAIQKDSIGPQAENVGKILNALLVRGRRLLLFGRSKSFTAICMVSISL